MSHNPTITVRISAATRWQLTTLMNHYAVTRSDVIRMAIEQLHRDAGLPDKPDDQE